MCRIPAELTPFLEMYLTRLLLWACSTSLLEIIKLLKKPCLAMIMSARFPCRRAGERAILSTRGRPAETPGFKARARHLPRDVAAGRHRHRRRVSLRGIAPHRSHRRPGLQRLCSRHLMPRDATAPFGSPPVAHDVARPSAVRTRSTNLSIPEAKRDWLLPPCSCEFPPVIGATPIDFISCATQHMLLVFHLSLPKLCLMRAPTISVMMVGTKYRSRFQQFGGRLHIYKASVVPMVS